MPPGQRAPEWLRIALSLLFSLWGVVFLIVGTVHLWSYWEPGASFTAAASLALGCLCAYMAYRVFKRT